MRNLKLLSKKLGKSVLKRGTDVSPTETLTKTEITLRYIKSLECRVKRLEKREWVWIIIIFGSIGVNITQYMGLIPGG